MTHRETLDTTHCKKFHVHLKFFRDMLQIQNIYNNIYIYTSHMLCSGSLSCSISQVKQCQCHWGIGRRKRRPAGWNPSGPCWRFRTWDGYPQLMINITTTLWWTNKKLWKDPPFFMGKSTISMAIFHCYVSSPEGISDEFPVAGDNYTGILSWWLSP